MIPLVGDQKMTSNYKAQITQYILENYKATEPILQKNLYRVFAMVNPITIRQTLLRLSLGGVITKSESTPGVYFVSKQNTVLKTSSLDFTKLIENKFLLDANRNIIGYESGFSIANKLGLSSQTSSKVLIYSNAVADRRREIMIENRRFIVDKPRVVIGNHNYKFLQVLDLISDFDTYCELDHKKALSIIKIYLNDLTLSREEIDVIFESYPIKTERNYYKLGVDHVISQI